MPRNTDKNVYVTLSIPRDSPLFQALSMDTETSGRSLAAIAQLRLADYYRGSMQGSIASSSITTGPLALSSIRGTTLPLTLQASEPLNALVISTVEAEDGELEEFSLSSPRVRANAAAALDAMDI